jgi:hypothetical protein
LRSSSSSSSESLITRLARPVFLGTAFFGGAICKTGQLRLMWGTSAHADDQRAHRPSAVKERSIMSEMSSATYLAFLLRALAALARLGATSEKGSNVCWHFGPCKKHCAQESNASQTHAGECTKNGWTWWARLMTVGVDRHDALAQSAVINFRQERGSRLSPATAGRHSLARLQNFNVRQRARGRYPHQHHGAAEGTPEPRRPVWPDESHDSTPARFVCTSLSSVCC